MVFTRNTDCEIAGLVVKNEPFLAEDELVTFKAKNSPTPITNTETTNVTIDSINHNKIAILIKHEPRELEISEEKNLIELENEDNGHFSTTTEVKSEEVKIIQETYDKDRITKVQNSNQNITIKNETNLEENKSIKIDNRDISSLHKRSTNDDVKEVTLNEDTIIKNEPMVEEFEEETVIMEVKQEVRLH